jgi:transposase
MNMAGSPGEELPGLESGGAVPVPVPAVTPARPRVKPVDRSQMSWQMMDVERLIEPEHPARAIWELVGRLKLDGLYAPIEAVEGTAGRTPWDPRLLVSLWIYAYSRGISSARELARRCSYEPAFQWLCGLGEINHHTLSDFRVDHDAGLRELFVQVLGVLSSEGLVSLERVMHDGTRIKACAGADSFRREQRLQEHLEAARKQVEAMADPRQEEPARKRAARGGSDYGHLIGAVAQVEANLGQKPAQVVVDGGVYFAGEHHGHGGAGSGFHWFAAGGQSELGQPTAAAGCDGAVLPGQV